MQPVAENIAEPRRVVILTRFSVVTEETAFAYTPAWYHRYRKFLPKPLRRPLRRRAMPPDLAAKCAVIFDAARLRRRFHLFETITLPSLAGQRDAGFLHAVLYAPLLPAPWQDRLLGLAATWGFEAVAVEPHESIAARSRAIVADLARALPPDDARVASVRLDDDDALAEDFVAKLRARSALAAHGDVVSFADGYTLHLVEGRRPELRPTFSPFGAMGMARVSNDPGAVTTIWDAGSHTRVAQKWPVTLMPDAGMFLCTSHIDNDSLRFSRRSGRRTPPIADAEAILARRFHIDLSAVAPR